MKLKSLHEALLGDWSGEKSLWFDPKARPHAVCASTLSVAPEALGQFLALRYRWSFESKPQEGLLLVGNDNSQDAVSAAWVDSFHSSGAVMKFSGSASADGFSVLGSYAAPPGPDWGWSITLKLVDATRLEVLMHNIEPGKPPERAVLLVWTR